MRLLCLDVGSSSIKAGYFRGGRFRALTQTPVESKLSGVRAEIPAESLLKAVEDAVRQAMDGHKHLDAIVLDTFCPGLVMLDKRNAPILGCVTHQDRRSVKQAAELEAEFGEERLLKLSGNRPFPGGIASSTLRWCAQNEKRVFAAAARIGQPSSLIIRHLTDAWVVDPSQAAFMGLFDIHSGDWSEELCEAVGVKRSQLPSIAPADSVAGTLTAAVAARLDLPKGTPVIGGLVDTSAAMLATKMHAGQLVHSAGSTDVLAMALVHAQPARDILTRPVGTGAVLAERFLAVSTIAAGGSTIRWMFDNFYRDMKHKDYRKLVDKLCREATDDMKGKRPVAPRPAPKSAASASRQATPDDATAEADSGVVFEPYLAGDRTSMEQRRGAFIHLSLSNTRDDFLESAVRALIGQSLARFQRLQTLHAIDPTIYTMGGQHELADAMHRVWPGKYKFEPIEHEALTGLARLGQQVLDAGAGGEVGSK